MDNANGDQVEEVTIDTVNSILKFSEDRNAIRHRQSLTTTESNQLYSTTTNTTTITFTITSNFNLNLNSSCQNNEFDDDDEDDNDIDPDQDTIKNERGHAEMHELSADKLAVSREREEAKRLAHRRLSLKWYIHMWECTLEYGKITLVALIACIACILLAYAFASPHWINRNNAIFTAIQFWAVYGSKRFMEVKFYLWTLAAIALYIVVPYGMYYGDHSYWFWLGDVILLVFGYCGLSFVMGYIGKPYQTTSERRRNGLAFLGTEVLVSATALVYGMFLINVYSGFSNYLKVAWRLVVHPIYFEIFMMIPVRLLVTKQSEKKGVNIMHNLAVVHSQAHISTLGRMMISTIGDTKFTIISVILLNMGKLIFRSSVQIRDKYASKVVSKFIGHEHKESKKFVRAVGLYTELIMENASIPSSAFAMWIFYDSRALFFLPYPPGGSFTLADATINVVIQLVVAFPFDILTIWLNERHFNLPMERAWLRMREKWFKFFGFLIYGVATMGMVGVLYMAAKVPRFVTCGSQDVCSCKFVEDCSEFIADKLS
eukprot:gene7467-8736_t